MELAEEAIEEIALGRCMPVTSCPAALVVGPGARGSGKGGQRPHVPGGAKAVVLDESAANESPLSRGSSDRCGSAIGLQGARICEAVPVVSDFSQEPGAELRADPGEAEQNLGVGVGEEGLLDRDAELVDGLAGSIENE